MKFSYCHVASNFFEIFYHTSLVRDCSRTKNLPQMNRINADFNIFSLGQGEKITKVGVFKSKCFQKH